MYIHDVGLLLFVFILQAVEKMKERLSPVPSDSQSVSSHSDVDKATGQRGQEEGDENKDRGNWAGQMDFILSLIGSATQH